jgi:hypothetical protein
MQDPTSTPTNRGRFVVNGQIRTWQKTRLRSILIYILHLPTRIREARQKKKDGYRVVYQGC